MNDRQLLASSLSVACIGLASGTGLVDLSLVDNVVVLGIAVVLPLALPGGWTWAGAAFAALLSFTQPTGAVAATFVVPWLVMSVWSAFLSARAPTGDDERLTRAAQVTAALYSVVAATSLTASRLGIALFGIGEPIVELTAVHYTYAGSAALVLAARCLTTATGRWRRVAEGAVLITAAAPPIVAAGFVTHAAIPQVGGAALMTIGVWLTASLEVRAAFARGQSVVARLLLGVSGVAIWIPMVLAVAWASGQHWDVPALSVPDMARTHGLANALAFVLCGLLGRRSEVATVAVRAEYL